MENNSNLIPLVAIYCRLSEEDRFKNNENDDSNSIINQKALLTEYCIEKNWKIYDVYSDDDYTGSDRNRPEFNRLLEDARQHKFDIILCKTQSRFTREIELVEKYINYLLPIWGIRFISLVDNADTAVKGNKKSRQINGLINEWYLEDMSENIKAVLTSRRKNGFFIGAFAPYGYKKDPNQKGHLIIDEEAAATVRLIYDLYISGKGRTAIARELNARHIPTPTDYKLAHGDRYKNNFTATHDHLWRYFMISKILTSETYIGNLVQNKAHSISYKSKIIKPTQKSEWIRVEDTHEPIIERKTWDLAQQILNSKQKPTFEKVEESIFRKKVFCSRCGRVMRTSRNGERRYFRCSTKYYAPEACEGIFINYEKLYTLVFDEFNVLVAQMANEDEISESTTLTNKSQEMLNYYCSELTRAEKSVDENSKYLKSLYVDKVKGIIDEDTYIDLLNTFKGEKEKQDIYIGQIKERILQIKEEMLNIESKREIIKRYIHCDKLTYEMVEMFIERIVVNPKPKYSKQDNIEIYWKF